MKAMKVCICKRFFADARIRNRTKVTILQNPKEKDHALGSSRVAMLGLENIELVPAQEADASVRIEQRCRSRRKRCEVESKESPFLPRIEAIRLSKIISDVFKHTVQCNIASDGFETKPDAMESDPSSEGMASHVGDKEGSKDDNMHCKLNAAHGLEVYPCMRIDRTHMCLAIAHDSSVDPSLHSKRHGNEDDIYGQRLMLDQWKASIPHGVSLLYPSEKAVELSASLVHKAEGNLIHGPLCHHLIVLDGTWSKAKRMYIENPWLHDLPHYKLLVASPSLYGAVRKEPKPECISTLESIVYALKVLEPDIADGLDGLLAVFDSMIEDQRHFMNLSKSSIQKQYAA
jgi:DTW domain-containing protein YfiP